MKRVSNTLLTLFMFAILPASIQAVELGEFCWEGNYFNVTGSWQMQVTQHGNYYAVHGKTSSSDGVSSDEGAVMGSGYATGAEARIAMIEVAINEPYGIDDMWMVSSVFVVNLTDFSATYHFIEEDIEHCLPDAAPCAKAIPATPVTCQ